MVAPEANPKRVITPERGALSAEGTPGQHHPGSCSSHFLLELPASCWESPEAHDIHTGPC